MEQKNKSQLEITVVRKTKRKRHTLLYCLTYLTVYKVGQEDLRQYFANLVHLVLGLCVFLDLARFCMSQTRSM